MNVGNSKLILAAYLGGAALLVLGMYGSMVPPREIASELEQATEDAEPQFSPLPRRPPAKRVIPLARRAGEDEEAVALQRLREQLEARTVELQRQHQELAAARAEVQQLRVDADRYLGLLGGLLGSDTVNTNVALEPPLPAAAEVPTEEPNSEEASFAELELMLAQTEIEAALTRMDELEGSLQQHSELLEEASRALVAGKSASVPVLVEMLQRGSTTGRRWAAELLGRLEGDAAEAEMALLDATDDIDATVREAARAALRKIPPRP